MQDKDQKKSLFKIIVGFGIGFILILALFRIFSPNSAIISGTIRYNGPKPVDPTNGKIVVQIREIGDTNYQIAEDNLPLKNNVSWSWDKAIEGKTYQMVSYIEYQGKRISDSSSITLTAPATNQIFTFNLTADQIPNSSNQTGTVTISGELDLNGYVPDGSTINISAKEGTGDFQLLSQGIPAIDGRKLSWNAAKAGAYYTFRGELIDPIGIGIGTSDNITMVGPAKGQTMRINSTEKAPAQQTSISGTVILNGPIQPNSSILLLQRKPGESNYSAFDRIPAVSNSTWSWDNAVSGQAYEISANFQVNEKDTSMGNVLRVTAPAEDEVITINTNLSLTPPTKTPVASCGNQQEGKWNVTLSFPAIPNASQYYLQAGTSQGEGDLLGEKINATSGTITRNILVNDGQTNHARYTYAFNSSCTDQQCFSGTSPTLIFKCPQ